MEVNDGMPHLMPEAAARLAAFRRDVLVVLVHHLRVTSWITGHKWIPRVWESAGLKPAEADEIYNPDWTVADWKLEWKDIARLDLAVYLDNMFHYGHLGLLDTGWEPMEDETGYTWISLFLLDLSRSAFLEEWSAGFSGEGEESVGRCLQVAELANARMVLETGRPFCPALSAYGKDEQATEDALTVRQMALLACMEEMSIRAAANPKKPNPLVTFSEGGRTRIALPEARRWLQSKGRHLQVRSFDSGRNSDLAGMTLSTLEDLAALCRRRLDSLRAAAGTGEWNVDDARVAGYLDYDFSRFGPAWEDGQQRAALADPDFLAALARCLEFPAELLALRAREVLARDELQRVQAGLRQLSAGV